MELYCFHQDEFVVGRALKLWPLFGHYHLESLVVKDVHYDEVWSGTSVRNTIDRGQFP